MSQPDYILPTALTVSEQIIGWISGTLAAAPFDPNNPDSPLLFETVKRGTINDIRRADSPAAAIEEGSEKTEDVAWPMTDKVLRLFVNFKIFSQSGVDPYQVVRYYFGRIVNLLVTQGLACGGLALDCREAGNTPEVNGQVDTEPGGCVILDIHYRHAYGDMFTGM